MTNVFVVLHAELMNLYFGLCDSAPDSGIHERLAKLRDDVQCGQCADSLIAYERYLDLIARHLNDDGLRDRLTLLDESEFKRALNRDPSQPYALLGAALARRRQGDDRRARQLLRRLASSLYPERKLAQHLLVPAELQNGLA